jgi:hypothetical protein
MVQENSLWKMDRLLSNTINSFYSFTPKCAISELGIQYRKHKLAQNIILLTSLPLMTASFRFMAVALP